MGNLKIKTAKVNALKIRASKIKIPVLPFDGYTWRWAEKLNTESLNEPRLYHGVLKALRRCEGKSPNSKAFKKELENLKKLSGTNLRLVKKGKDRNLIRQSGQYWVALNLLDKTTLKDGKSSINLTPFGRCVADGEITHNEFVAYIIKKHELPNKYIEKDNIINCWKKCKLTIRPLELILKIVVGLRDYHEEIGYITPHELFNITIPLAGNKASLNLHIDAVLAYRLSLLTISKWPKPSGSHDDRFAKEHLRFLEYNGICKRKPGGTSANEVNMEDKFFLEDMVYSRIADLLNNKIQFNNPAKVIDILRNSDFVANMEEVDRERVTRQVLNRPEQRRFRKKVFNFFKHKCLITGCDVLTALEAAHIIPVTDKGSDALENGLCLRADIHNLFDTGHLRIDENGNIHLSTVALRHYKKLYGLRVKLPRRAQAAIKSRWKYY
jgi:hypothetical protein